MIYCIGDSHVDFFSGWNSIGPEYPETRPSRFPFFKSFRLGPSLAYNLCEKETKTRSREKLFEILRSANPQEIKIMLSFGEIDCRAHLIKESLKQNRPIDKIAYECADRYFKVVNEVKELGFETIVWNSIPSTLYQSRNPEFPTEGTCVDRNKATRFFNSRLNNLCRDKTIPFISIFEKLVDKNDFTKMKYYMDDIHLSQKIMPVVLKEFQSKISGIDFRITIKQKIDLFLDDIRRFKLRKFIRKLDISLYRMLTDKKGDKTILSEKYVRSKKFLKKIVCSYKNS
jgi:lysophospholipase L1-like esterase